MRNETEEHMQEEGNELFLIVVCAAVVLVCYSEAVVYTVEETKWIIVQYPNSIIFCVLENPDF